MKTIHLLFLLTLLSLQTSLSGQSKIRTVIPSVEQETDYVWRTIRDIRFFEQHNYSVSLPAHPLIDSLLDRSRKQQLLDTDYLKLKALMEKTIYNTGDYQQAFEKIEAQKALIHKMLKEHAQLQLEWDFQSFEGYPIVLTLYGSGGSFDPDNGSILIFATTDGRFKQYDNPANTIIHEIIHIGIEYSIIQKYEVPHGLKERIVDHYVKLCFGSYLPDYRIQNMGDPTIDQQFKSKDSLKQLDQVVGNFLKKN